MKEERKRDIKAELYRDNLYIIMGYCFAYPI